MTEISAHLLHKHKLIDFLNGSTVYAHLGKEKDMSKVLGNFGVFGLYWSQILVLWMKFPIRNYVFLAFEFINFKRSRFFKNLIGFIEELKTKDV